MVSPSPDGYKFALVTGIAEYDNMPGLVAASKDRGNVRSTLRDLGFNLSGLAAQDRVSKLDFLDALEKLVQKGELALAAGKSPILFFWHSGHGLQVHKDALPHLVASDSEPDSVDTLVDTDYLVAKLNEVRAEKNCKLRVIIVLDCCRFQSKGPTTSVTINRRQKLPSLKHDFYIILACDPGRGAADFEHGGVLTQEVLRLLPYRKPILQIFHEVEKRVKRQRPWVRSRAGDDEPVLGTRDNEDFPNRSPRGRTETAQLLGIEDDMYSPHSPQSPQCLDSDSLSACDTFRLYWFPFAGLLAVGCHAVLLTLWVFGVGINKRYATRLAMPPCMALMDLASLSQAYYRRLSELKPSCGLACSVFLHQVWPKLECHLNRAYYPSLFLMLAVGELKRDRDVLAAIISCILAVVCYFAVFRFKIPAILTVYDRFDDTSIDRATWTWFFESAVAFYFAESGYRCLQLGDDESMRNVERNFLVFMLLYIFAWYFTMFHRANPAFADCGLQTSLSRKLSEHMTIVTLAAVLCPLTQSVLRSAPIWNFWPWQLWLFAEYVGLFGFCLIIGVVFPRRTTAASDDMDVCA